MTPFLFLTGVMSATFRPGLPTVPTHFIAATSGGEFSWDNVLYTNVVVVSALIVFALVLNLEQKRAMSTKVYAALTFHRIIVILSAVGLFYVIPEKVARDNLLVGTLVPMGMFLLLSIVAFYFNEGYSLKVDSKLNNTGVSLIFLMFFAACEAIFVAFTSSRTQNFQTGLNFLSLHALVAYCMSLYALFMKVDFLKQSSIVYVILANFCILGTAILTIGVVLADYEIDWVSNIFALIYVGVFHSFICFWFRKMNSEEQAFLGRDKHAQSDIPYSAMMVYPNMVFGWMYMAFAMIFCTA